MAEETKPVVPVPEPPKPKYTQKQAQDKLNSLGKQLEGYQGKPGYNPYLWKKAFDWDRLVKGVNEASPTVIEEVMVKLPTTIAPTAKDRTGSIMSTEVKKAKL